jgi:hypothetical protein
MRVNIVCVNVDAYYDMEYVEVLFDMVLRNASRTTHELAFWCITDRPDELPKGVNPILSDPNLPGWWQKLYCFSPDMPWQEGERVIQLDLDIAVTGRLEDLLDTKGIIRDWHWEGAKNTSVMSWDHGEHRGAWEHFSRSFLDWNPGPLIPKAWLPSHAKNAGDMEYLMYASAMGWDPDPWDHYPDPWFPSYRSCHAWPAEGSKAVIFHGRPKPHEITDGWVPNVWKVGGFTSLPVMGGANVSTEHLLTNVRSAVQRDLEWFTGFGPHNGRAVLVAGGPSARERISEIRAHYKRGAKVITVNNAWRMMAEAGIKPHAHVMLDARPENADFVKDAPDGVRYLIASQCHPDVFDALAGKEVVVWHNGFGDNAEMKEALAPWWGEGPNQKPCVLVPGGGTVGLRTLWLLTFSGFRTVHVYGMDSSYADDGKHHAYAQALNDTDQTIEVVMGGKRYRAALWMVRQANEFRETWRALKDEGVTVHVHGSGLIPDMAKRLRSDERAAA